MSAAVHAPQWLRAQSNPILQEHVHLSSSSRKEKPDAMLRFLNEHQDRTVTMLSELIIPATDTPGAREANVNQFIDRFLGESDDSVQEEFTRGLLWLDGRSDELYGCEFVKASPEQQVQLLTRISLDFPEEGDRDGAHFFKAMKWLTVTGYYSSEVGWIEELGQGKMFFEDYLGCRHDGHRSHS